MGAHPKASKVFAAPTVLQGEPITLDYYTWFYNEPGRGDAWTAMIAEFEASQSDIKVNMTGWPFDDFANNIIVQLQAGKLDGDLFQTTPDLVLRLLAADVLTNLNPVLEANNITTLSQAHDYITVDGGVMGLDVVTVVFGLFYNTELFEKAGITELPVDPAQWMEVSTALTERPNQFGLFNDHLIVRGRVVLVHAPAVGLHLRWCLGRGEYPDAHVAADPGYADALQAGL